MGINIDELTFGQLKQIAALFGNSGASQAHKPDMLAHLVGKKVLIRDHKAGLFLTTLIEVNKQEWLGGKSRKIHYWEKAGAVEGIAETGIDLKESRITVSTEMSAGKELIQICPVSDKIYDEIMGAAAWNPK